MPRHVITAYPGESWKRAIALARKAAVIVTAGVLIFGVFGGTLAAPDHWTGKPKHRSISRL